MKKLLTFVATVASYAFGMSAQVVTTVPEIVQEDTPQVEITYHADQGSRGLMGLSAGTPVYVHIGVITNLSNGDSDWKHVISEWPAKDGSNAQVANTPKNTMTYVGPNTYTLSLGDLRTFFNVTDPTEHIQKIAMVFRNADGSKEGKTATGGDIFVNVLAAGFDITLESNATSTLLSKATTIQFTTRTTAPADLTLSVNGTNFASQNNATALTGSYNFDKTGSYTVTATAVYGGETYTKTMNVAYPGASTAGTYPGGVPKMGTVKNADGSVTFCLAAPGKNSVVMVPSWDNYDILDKNTMKYQDYNGNRYFWITVSGLKDDQWYPYYYVVDATYRVGDPYAELVLDPYSDKWLSDDIWPSRPQYPYGLFNDVVLAVYRGDLNTTYKFSNFTIPDHDNLVVYEMLFRDFTGTVGEANANGTVRKAMGYIPYIKALGFNAVELMPIMEFNGNNSWGYNTNFYFAPDKAYGSPTDYKDFIEECHKNGIAVILDIVFNQSDGLHPWYQLYPVGSNPFYNKTAPHAYSVLNDWNQGNELVQQQWTDCLIYWMTNYNVDGFRFDLVKGLGNNESYSGGTEAYNQSRVSRMIRLHEVIKSVKPNGIHINEDLAGAQEEIALGNDGQIQWANINGNSCEFTMGYNEGTSKGALTSAFLSTNNGGRPWGSTVSYAESHDEERMAYKNNTWGITDVKNDPATSYKRLGSLAAVMLMTPGPKMVWQFGELGADQTTKNADGGNNTDPKIVIWNWLDPATSPYGANPQELMYTYMFLINLRMENPDLFARTATFTSKGTGTALSNNRILSLNTSNKEVVLFCNPSTSGSSKTVGTNTALLTTSNARMLYHSPGFEPTLSGTGTSVSVSVPPHSFAIYGTTNVVSGIENVEVQPENAPCVFGAKGQIVIDGEFTHAEVYSMDGRACGLEGLIPGIYVVRVDGTSHKVVVK